METKVCTTCGPQPLSNFRIRNCKPISQCKDCTKAAAKKHRDKPEIRAKRLAYYRQYERTESGKAARARSVLKLTESGWMSEHGIRKHRLRVYGLTEFEYKKLVQRQDGKCAICYIEPVPWQKKKRGLHVDHDHETGYIRGLLCGNCNAGLGHLKDSVENLASAIQYLVRSKARQETKRETETG